MKIAVVTDSNSCITQQEAKRLGVYVVPMPFMIDEKEYYEDINLSQEEFYEMINAGAEVVTSQPSPQTVLDLWDELLKEYEQVIYIPMSSGLSGSCQTAMMLAEDYDNKIFVVNNQRICPTLKDSVVDALELIKKGYDGSQIKDILEEHKFDSSIYITVGTLEYLRKGGRITPAVAAIGNLLRIKPILSIQGEKLDAFATARTINHSKATMMNQIKKDIDSRIGCDSYEDMNIAVAYSADREPAEEFAKEVKELFPNNDIFICPLSLSVACHIGPSSLAIAVSKKIKV